MVIRKHHGTSLLGDYVQSPIVLTVGDQQLRNKSKPVSSLLNDNAHKYQPQTKKFLSLTSGFPKTSQKH